jgi:chlorinating enzyme
MPATQTGRLTSEQVEFYHENGYLLFKEPVFPQEKFDRLKALYEEILAQRGENGLFNLHIVDPRFLEFVLADEMLDLVEPVMGPNIGTWTSSGICKPPYTGKVTPWHEDSAYWKSQVSNAAGICSVWLAIDDALPENGCMKVIPGTHNNGYSEYVPVEDASKNIFGTEIDPSKIDDSKAVYFELKSNQCGLFEGRIIHGADANTSPKRRAGYAMRYFPTTTKIYKERLKPDERSPALKLYLARGKDIAGNPFEDV